MDLTGQRVGRLLLVKRLEKDRAGYFYLAKCDCGNEIKYTSMSTRKSCGCLSKEAVLKFCQKAPGESGFNSLYGLYKRAAIAHNRVFELTKEQFKILTQGLCKYCGASPSAKLRAKTENSTYTYNGIDRVDASKGYTVDNCVPCCCKCNVAKSDYSVEEFLEWAERLVDFQRRKHTTSTDGAR